MHKIVSSFLFAFMICSCSVLIGQNKKTVAIVVSKLQIDADTFLGYDTFGYSYHIKNNSFIKTKANEIFEYKNIALGKITKADLQNPLKLVLFYGDFNIAILLDNQLNKINEINFSQLSNPIVVNAIGMSAQNQLWIYDAINQQVGLFDYLKNEYKAVSLSLTDGIQYYQTDLNTFYWIDYQNEWYSCDIFGKISRLGIIPEFEKIEIINKQKYIFSFVNVLYFKDSGATELNTISEIEISQKSFAKFCYKDQILSIFTTKEIVNYKIVTP